MLDKGLVQIYTGDGKGKTTAAFGQALRAIGRGLKVIIIQFIKAGESGEVLFVEKNIPSLKLYRFNSQNKSVWTMNGEELSRLGQETRQGFDLAKKILIDAACDMLILDEFLIAYNMGFISIEDFRDMIALKPDSMEIIMTGRNAGNDLIRHADLVTEMKKVKHPFDNNIQARTGIER